MTSALPRRCRILFSSFIGFDSIAQAGGEARNQDATLPLAIGIAVVVVGTYYFPVHGRRLPRRSLVLRRRGSDERDITAPGLFSYLLPGGWAVAIVAGAAIALINDLPAMLLAVSRLMFAWAEDGIFPRWIARVHPRRHTPQTAILLSGVMASIGILGSHFAGDFFLGIDIMVTSMLVNFLLMCLTVLSLPHRNPALASEVKVLTSRPWQVLLAGAGVVMLTGFLVIHIVKDLTAETAAWYFHSTPVWLIVMTIATGIYFRELKKLKRDGVDVADLVQGTAARVDMSEQTHTPSSHPTCTFPESSPDFGRSLTWSATSNHWISSKPPNVCRPTPTQA